MRRVQAALCSVTVLLPFVPALALAGDLPILPGWWRWDSELAVVSSSHELRCIRPADIDKVLSGAVNRHYSCVYSTSSFRGGQARLTGVCTDKKGARVPIDFRGSYTPVSFRLTGTVSPSLGGLSIPLGGSLKATRLAETCPPGPSRVQLKGDEADQDAAAQSPASGSEGLRATR